MKELYKRYLLEKNKLSSLKTSYIDFKSFLSVSIFYDFSEDVTYIKFIKSLLGRIFFKRDLQIKENFKDGSFENILFKRNEFNRNDYKNIEDSFINASIKRFNCIELSFGNRQFDISFIKNIYQYLKYKRQLKNVELYNYKTKVLKFLEAKKYDRLYRKLLNKFSINKIIVFCDIHENDNYLVQLGNYMNIDTYTLQHGMFNYESRKYDDPNFLHCEASKSRYVFVWGEYTKDEFIKSGREAASIYISGNPKLPSNLHFDISSFKMKNKFIVVFDHNLYVKSNINLLKLADAIRIKTGMKYEVKMHPNNNINDYNEYCQNSSISFYKNEIDYSYIISNAKFVICHNTAMYYELTNFLVPTFRLKDDLFSDIDSVNFNKVSNADELNDKLICIENNSDKFFNNLKELSNYYFYKSDMENAILNGLINK